jgi:RNA polymerase sigma-70 factor (ECF subfamily)
VSEPSSRSDEELVELATGAVRGDLRAFDVLVERHQSRILANCRYLTRSPDDAEDLAQEVFVKAYFGLDRFEGRSEFRTWIQRIKVNHCLNHLRRKRDKVFLDVQDEALGAEEELRVDPVADRRLERREDRELVREVIDGLPDTLRLPLLLRDLDELSYQEVADSLGIGLSAAKMRIKRGREEFRRRFERAKRAAEAPDVEEGAIPS